MVTLLVRPVHYRFNVNPREMRLAVGIVFVAFDEIDVASSYQGCCVVEMVVEVEVKLGRFRGLIVMFAPD